MPRQLQQRFTACIAIMAVLLLFVAPVVSKSLMHHPMMGGMAQADAAMPHDMHAMAMPAAEHAGHHGMDPAEMIFCGYCELLIHVPLLLWTFVPLLWLATRPKRKLKRAKGGFAASRHWHITLGVALLAGLLFFSATGLTWSQWAGGNIDALRANLGWLTPQVNTSLQADAPQTPADPHAEHRGMMPGMKMGPAAQANALNGDWDRALHAARAAGIDAAKVELRQPKGEGKAWTVTEVDRSWPTQVDAVAIAPQSFVVIDQVRFDTFPLIAKLTRWGIDAHMGILFGLPNQLLLAAFGLGLCLMIALGYRMWWIRRPAAGAQHPVHTLIAAWLALSLPARTVTLLVASALGYCLPVMGVSLAALLLVDVWRWRGQRQGHRDETPEAAARRAEVRKFRAAVATVAVAVGCVMGRAILGGTVEQFQLPIGAWSAQIVIMQSLMVLLYTLVFTLLLSIPLWYFFLGEKEGR
ncbi:TPA: DUF2534 family protein [Serratia marcescens]